jgi:hypothetical protein
MRVKKSMILSGLVLMAAFGLSPAAFAAKGVCKDGSAPPCGGGGGNKPPVEAVNNLSFPAVYTSQLSGAAASWQVAPGEFGVDYSYGCDKPETVETFSYPNTSCVDTLGAFLTASQCTAAGAPCEGFPVSRIYWQKVATNSWWAETAGPDSPVTSAYLDWGDNLESTTWNERSVIRVETTPYASLIPWPFDATLEPTSEAFCEDAAAFYGLNPLDVCNVGFQMWHVSGHGPDEQWGARASDDATPLPWIYLSPFEIVHTFNARLHIAKLEAETASCDTSTPPAGFDWDAVSAPPVWHADGGDACTLRDIPYTAELNVGGRYVYGYNWMLGRDEVSSGCGQGWLKTGWWRLTFYTPAGEVFFDSLNPVVEPLGPPPGVTAFPRQLTVQLRRAFEEAEEEGPLYAATIDYANNLTYIDICIEARAGGGGGGRP